MATERPGNGARPFLKWAGGKRNLIEDLLARRPSDYGCYHEPFLGGGALFFALGPGKAVLSDINRELVNAYTVVRDRVEDLVRELATYENEAEFFYEVRSRRPEHLDEVSRAARLVYLNKTCYNGLYRENSKGEFNVPFGRYRNPAICDADNLRAASKALRGKQVEAAAFEGVLERAAPGDFVYFDPPYAPVSATSSFTAYSKGGFSFEEQERLASAFDTLAKRECLVMLSNSDVPALADLYGRYRVERVMVPRAINSRADRRGPVTELLVRNY